MWGDVMQTIIATAALFIAYRSWRASEASVELTHQIAVDSQEDARRRTTFDHLHELDLRLTELWRMGVDVDRALEEIRTGGALSEASVRLVSLLNAMDLLAFGMQQRMVDAHLTREYFDNMNVVTPWLLPLIREFRECCGDANAYIALERMLVTAQPHRLEGESSMRERPPSRPEPRPRPRPEPRPGEEKGMPWPRPAPNRPAPDRPSPPRPPIEKKGDRG